LRLSARRHATLNVVGKFGETAFDRNLGDDIPSRILEHNVNDLAIGQGNAGRTREKSQAEHVSPSLYPAIIGAGEMIDIAVDLVSDRAVAPPAVPVQKLSTTVKAAEVLKRTSVTNRLHRFFSIR
jgi:hypothetical protein